MAVDVDFAAVRNLVPLVRRTDAIRQQLLAKFYGGKGLPPSVVGREREIFVSSYLRNTYPSHFRFSSGAVIDHAGNVSGQLDIVVNSPEGPSFPMSDHEDAERLFLADTVAAAISVKSNIGSQIGEVQREVDKLALLRKEGHGFVQFSIEERSPLIPLFVVGYDGPQSADSLLALTTKISPPGIVKAAICLSSSAICLFSATINSYVVCQDDSSFLRFVIALHTAISGNFAFGDDLWRYAVEVKAK